MIKLNRSITTVYTTFMLGFLSDCIAATSSDECETNPPTISQAKMHDTFLQDMRKLFSLYPPKPSISQSSSMSSKISSKTIPVENKGAFQKFWSYITCSAEIEAEIKRDVIKAVETTSPVVEKVLQIADELTTDPAKKHLIEEIESGVEALDKAARQAEKGGAVNDIAAITTLTDTALHTAAANTTGSTAQKVKMVQSAIDAGSTQIQKEDVTTGAPSTVKEVEEAVDVVLDVASVFVPGAGAVKKVLDIVEREI